MDVMADELLLMETGFAASEDRRRRAILRAARASFMTAGFAATRMEPLAREANVSTATLYSYFGSKSVLFEAVIRDVAEDFIQRMEKVRGASGPAREQLTVFMTAYAEFISDPLVRSVFRLVVAERSRLRDMALSVFERGRHDFGGPLMRMLGELHARGELVVHKPSWAAGQLMGMVEHPIFFMPLATGDELFATRSSAHIVADCVETFMARFGAPVQG